MLQVRAYGAACANIWGVYPFTGTSIVMLLVQAGLATSMNGIFEVLGKNKNISNFIIPRAAISVHQAILYCTIVREHF